MKRDAITSVIALLNLAVFVGLTVALVFDQIDKPTFYELNSVMGTVSITALGYFAKDRTPKEQ
jgi:hypothetical protein